MENQAAAYGVDFISAKVELFEEITRYRVLKGILPSNEIYILAELNALGAALTAWTAACHPE